MEAFNFQRDLAAFLASFGMACPSNSHTRLVLTQLNYSCREGMHLLTGSPSAASHPWFLHFLTTSTVRTLPEDWLSTSGSKVGLYLRPSSFDFPSDLIPS